MGHDASVAFVGLMRADGVDEVNPAFSQAGQLFQERLLGAVADAGLNVTHVFLQRPIPSFPADGRLWIRGGTGTVCRRFRATLLPFLNWGPVKTATISLSLIWNLVAWGWRFRGAGTRCLLLYNDAPPWLASIAAGRLIGAVVIAVVADIQVPGSGSVPATPLRWLQHRLQVRALPLCDGLVVLTHNIARDFAPCVPHIQMEGAVPDRLIETIVAQQDLEACSGDSSEPYDLDEPSRDTVVTLMYAGGLFEMKGVPLLLDAMERLPGLAYRLWITGDGPLRTSVERAAENDPRITYWGFPSYDEVLQLMRRATILINPHSTRHRSSRYVFPSKLVEYLAIGKPVITTRSTPEIADEYDGIAFVVDENPDAFANKIVEIAALSPRTRAEIGERARHFVLSQKSWTVQGERIARFITGQTDSHVNVHYPIAGTSQQ